jgi:hypothetical protein
MATNPHALKPAELVRLMNSTPLGAVINRDRIYRQRDQGGMFVGNGETFDLIRYAGWLFSAWVERQTDVRAKMSRSERHRVDEAVRLRMRRETIRNIGPITPIADYARREACRYDLALFIQTYAWDGKSPFSNDHLRVIKRIENAVLNGGRFVEAVFRGFGKTAISRLAVGWAILYGHRRFVPLVGANRAKAEENLDAIRGLLESVPLVDDFPEVCLPILRLDSISQRARSQLYESSGGIPLPTHLAWGKELVRLPMTDGAMDTKDVFHPNQAAGAIILSCGITSSQIRGLNKRRRDGIELRPDFAVLDDPQDDESAGSVQQVNKRMNIIKKAILRSAGHMGGMAVVMPCTVIQKDDLADQLLDPKKNPSWQGERIPFVRKWADRHADLWMDEYAAIRASYNRDDPDDFLRARREATAFYRTRRAEMDAGCDVAWEHCYAPDDDEISAVQHAYNALIDDGEEVFASEFQNQPLVAPEDEGQLTRDEVAAKLNRFRRGAVPVEAQKLTAFVDVQKACLYWVVCAWNPDFTGHVVDYGVFPEQPLRQFTLRQVKKTLSMAFPSAGQEGAWRAGLDALTDRLISREWKREDGASLRISRLLIDSADGNAQGVVLDFCRQSRHAAVVMPSRGVGVTAAKMPFSEYRRQRGDRVSEYNWRIPAPKGNSVRVLTYDTNIWKSFVRARWRTAMGDIGGLSLFGSKPDQHQMFIDQMVSEYSTRTEGRGRRVDEWAKRPNVSDNHFWDCLVGCAVAASEQDVVFAPMGGGVKPKKAPITLSAMQK